MVQIWPLCLSLSRVSESRDLKELKRIWSLKMSRWIVKLIYTWAKWSRRVTTKSQSASLVRVLEAICFSIGASIGRDVPLKSAKPLRTSWDTRTLSSSTWSSPNFWTGARSAVCGMQWCRPKESEAKLIFNHLSNVNIISLSLSSSAVSKSMFMIWSLISSIAVSTCSTYGTGTAVGIMKTLFCFSSSSFRFAYSKIRSCS